MVNKFGDYKIISIFALMEKEKLEQIKETIDGYEVKNLTYKKLDNIITGQVKDPINLFPDLHEGFIGAAWSVSGHPLKYLKGRKDLTLKIV